MSKLAVICAVALIFGAASARGDHVSSKSAGAPAVSEVPQSDAKPPRPLTKAEKQKAAKEKAMAVDAATSQTKEKPLIGDFPPRRYERPKSQRSGDTPTTAADPPPK
jgi:hypothetical protein